MLITAGVVLITALVAFVPIQLASRRLHSNREAIIAILLLWGLVTAASISYFVMKQMDWSATYLERVESGYYDPQNLSDKPAPPLLLWASLAGMYGICIFWAARPRPADHPPE